MVCLCMCVFDACTVGWEWPISCSQLSNVVLAGASPMLRISTSCDVWDTNILERFRLLRNRKVKKIKEKWGMSFFREGTTCVCSLSMGFVEDAVLNWLLKRTQEHVCMLSQWADMFTHSCIYTSGCELFSLLSPLPHKLSPNPVLGLFEICELQFWVNMY